MSTGNIKPATAVTIIDPRILESLAKIKADTESILAKVEQDAPKNEPPRYFPRGYFP